MCFLHVGSTFLHFQQERYSVCCFKVHKNPRVRKRVGSTFLFFLLFIVILSSQRAPYHWHQSTAMIASITFRMKIHLQKQSQKISSVLLLVLTSTATGVAPSEPLFHPPSPAQRPMPPTHINRMMHNLSTHPHPSFTIFHRYPQRPFALIKFLPLPSDDVSGLPNVICVLYFF